MTEPTRDFPVLSKASELQRFIRDMHCLAANRKLSHCLSHKPTAQINAVIPIDNYPENKIDTTKTAEHLGIHYEMPDDDDYNYKIFPGSMIQNNQLIQQIKKYVHTDILDELNPDIACAHTFLMDLIRHVKQDNSTNSKNLYHQIIAYKMTETQTIPEYLQGFNALKIEAELLKRQNPMLAQLCQPSFWVQHLVDNLVPMLRGYAFYLLANTNVTWSQFRTTLTQLAVTLKYEPATIITPTTVKQVSFVGTTPGSPPPAEHTNHNNHQQSRNSKSNRGNNGHMKGNRRGRNITCTFCNHDGHHVNDCRKKKRLQNRRNTNYNQNQGYNNNYQNHGQQQYQNFQPHQNFPNQQNNQNHQLQLANASNQQQQATSSTNQTFREDIADVMNKWGLAMLFNPNDLPTKASGSSSNQQQETSSDEVFPEPWARG
jgi:hypothetical protein